MKRRLTGVLVAAIAIVVVGCATIMHGTNQKIGISSTPTGASVSVDNKPLGVTPVFANLKRGDEHIVTIEMEGYEKTSLTITKSVSGWVWGNIAFGGLIGLAVDAITGSLYNLSPEQLSAQLQRTGGAVSSVTDGLYIVAVLVPDPLWQKVGRLEPQTFSLSR